MISNYFFIYIFVYFLKYFSLFVLIDDKYKKIFTTTRTLFNQLNIFFISFTYKKTN